MKKITRILWLPGLLSLATLAIFSCLEGDGEWLDENGFCQPTNAFAYGECPELCDSTNKDHFCYCDPTDPNAPCFCDVTDTTKECYDSCKVLIVDQVTGIKSIGEKETCKKTPDTIVSDCPKDPLDPCTPECADLRTIDYTKTIAPIWEANACVTGCHIRGSQGFNNTGNLRKIKVRQGGKDTTVYRGLSYQPDLNALSMMINVPMYADSGNPNVPFWRVRPFDPDSSYLVRILSAANGTFVRMPNALPPVPEPAMNNIKQWIKEGACPTL